jgi:hypothetical protein
MQYRVNVDWHEVRDNYISDLHSTHRSLAAKYKLKYNTVCDRSRREHWGQERIQYQARRRAKLQEAALEKSAPLLLKEVNEKQLKWNEEMRWIINSKLKQRDAEGKIVVRSDITINDAYRATLTMIELYRCDRLALGASTDNIQPALPRDRFAEMSDDELQAELGRLRQIPMMPAPLLAETRVQ